MGQYRHALNGEFKILGWTMLCQHQADEKLELY